MTICFVLFLAKKSFGLFLVSETIVSLIRKQRLNMFTCRCKNKVTDFILLWKQNIFSYAGGNNYRYFLLAKTKPKISICLENQKIQISLWCAKRATILSLGLPAISAWYAPCITMVTNVTHSPHTTMVGKIKYRHMIMVSHMTIVTQTQTLYHITLGDLASSHQFGYSSNPG